MEENIPDTSPKPEKKTKTWKKVLRWAVQIVVIGAIGYFLVMTVVKNWNEVKAFPWHFNPWLLALSLLALAGSLFFMIFLWQSLLVRLGSKIPLGPAFRIFSLSSLGRYLPGKVWQVVGMVYLGKKDGVRAESGVWAALLAQILAILSGFLVTFIALFVEQERMLRPLLEKIGMGPISLWWMLLPVAAALVLIHPRILEWATNLLLKIMKRQPIKFNLTYPGLLLFFLLYVVSWFFYGTALYLFIDSVHPLPVSDWIVVTGSFAAADVLGVLAIFVPGGLGVREGVLTLFLTSLVSSGVAVALSFGQRLWFTVIELTFVLIALILTRRKNVKEKDGKEDREKGTGRRPDPQD